MRWQSICIELKFFVCATHNSGRADSCLFLSNFSALLFILSPFYFANGLIFSVVRSILIQQKEAKEGKKGSQHTNENSTTTTTNNLFCNQKIIYNNNKKKLKAILFIFFFRRLIRSAGFIYGCVQ